MKTVFGLGAPVLLLWGLACSAPGSREQGAGRGQEPVSVSVADVVAEDVAVELKALGTVEPAHVVEVVPQVTGQILETHFKEGDFVKKGALLFTIDTRPYRTTLAAAQAELARNTALADQAESEASRYAKLAESGLATRQELTRAEADSAALKALLEGTKAQIRGASLNVQFTQIRAPAEGRTGSVLVHAGNIVRANDARALVVIRGLTPTHVRFSVPEEYLPRLQEGLKQGRLPVTATPRGAGAQSSEGHVHFIESSVDSRTGTISLKAEFENRDHALWPGEFVSIVLGLALEKNQVVVPEVAVQQGQEGAYVFVVGADNKAELRPVSLLRVAKQRAIISSGLKLGERVVTDGHIRLRAGRTVKVSP